jgi:hypothetical protein
MLGLGCRFANQEPDQTGLRLQGVRGDLRGEAGISGLAKPNCNFWRDCRGKRFRWWRYNARL